MLGIKLSNLEQSRLIIGDGMDYLLVMAGFQPFSSP